MELSEKLQQLRKSAGFSQEKLAELLHVSRQAISRWESGATMPTLDNLNELCKVFNIPIGELLQAASNNDTENATLTIDSLRAFLTENETLQLRKEKQLRFILAGMGIGIMLITLGVVTYFSTQMNGLQSRINNIGSRIDSMQLSIAQNTSYDYLYPALPPQDSIVADYNYDISDYNPKTKAITMKIAAIPKTLTDDMTAIFTASASGMDIIEAEGVLTAGNIFQCDMTIPVQDEIKLSVSLQSNSEIQSQVLETISGLKRKYCMDTSVEYSGEKVFENGMLSLNGKVNTTVRPVITSGTYSNPSFVNYPLTGTVQILTDNKIVKEYPIDLTNLLLSSEAETSTTYWDNAMPETTEAYSSEYYFYTDILESFPVQDNSKVQLLISLTDNYDAVHTQVIDIN